MCAVVHMVVRMRMRIRLPVSARVRVKAAELTFYT